MKETEIKKDLNLLQILRDIAEGKLRKKAFAEIKAGDVLPTPENEAATLHGQGDLVPIKPIEDADKTKKKSGKQKSDEDSENNEKSAVAITANNYRQLYMEMKNQELGGGASGQDDRKMIEKKQAEARKAEEDRNKKIMEEKKANDQRYRAREIQSQISWWNGQMGQGQYDQSVILNNIQQLQSELGNIPQVFW